MGCGSSRDIGPQQNNNVPNGNVKSEPVPNNHHAGPAPKDDKKHKERRKSLSSSDGSSTSSVKQVEVKPERPAETQESEPEAEAPENKPDTEKDTEKPNFTEEALKSFVELETEIKELENKSRESILHAEYKRLVELHKGLQIQAQKVEGLKQQTIKEYQDIVQVTNPSVRAMFINQNQHDAQVAKEQQEYLDALNRQEVAQQNLDSAKEQYKNLYNSYNSHAETIKVDRKKLQDLKYKQELLLGKIFNDNYGSDKEWKLEMELDLVGEKKERIKSAHYKWTNAHKFVATAASQINWAAKRWGQIFNFNVQAQMAKYQMTAETRNHLVAAIQNMRTSHKFLEPLHVPYYSKDDITELEGSLNSIFHDVQFPTRYRQAHATFTEHFNKSKNLFNWVDLVVKNTINPDYNEAKKSYHVKYFELKEERLTLIQNIIKDKLGVDMKMELEKEEYKDTEESVVSDQQIQPGEVVKEEGDEQAPEPEAQSEEPAAEIRPEEPQAAEVAEGENTDAPATVPEAQPADAKLKVKAMPLSELAPAPKQEDLFGDIDQLKKKHDEEIKEFEKAQEMNKARVDQGLQEKLRARRMRQKRMAQQQEEEVALCGDGDGSLPAPLE